jgi:hypothetical protein
MDLTYHFPNPIPMDPNGKFFFEMGSPLLSQP